MSWQLCWARAPSLTVKSFAFLRDICNDGHVFSDPHAQFISKTRTHLGR